MFHHYNSSSMFNRKIIHFAIKCLTIVLVLSNGLQLYLYYSAESVSDEQYLINKNDNIILWWTPFVVEEGIIINCDNVRCFLTSNRKYKNDTRLKALMFYGSSFNSSDLPLFRKKELWGLLHEESPRNTPLMSHEPILSLFNYSSTFSRYSELPLTFQYLPSIQNITDQKYLVSFERKSSLENSLAPVIYLQSDCSTPNNRDSYVYELMKYIKVDSYGECLHNKDLPLSLTNPLETMMSEKLLHFVSQYKFAIAFENAVCEDYITEKLWRPIIAGAIPIYYGSPSIRDWLPNNNSAIFPEDFKTPKDLAKYLNYLANNDTVYNSYRKHKTKQIIENKFLLMNFRIIDWSPDDGAIGCVEEFQCLLCKNSYNNETKIVNKNHYDCPEPVSMLDGKYNISNWWHSDYHATKCEANALFKYLNNNNTSNDSFHFNYVHDNNTIPY